MSEGLMKESRAMVRARELNRTNEKRLSECIDNMAGAVERKLERLKIEGKSTLGFLQRLKTSSGRSQSSVEPGSDESGQFERLVNPKPKLSFSKVDYKQKKLAESSDTLNVATVSPACEGNPVPVRTVHPWTSAAAKTLAQSKPPQIPRPTARRRHSLGSDDTSSDDDDLAPLRRVKKKAGLKRKKVLEIRRSSLPAIHESRRYESSSMLMSNNEDDLIERSKVKASLTKLKKRSMSMS